VCPGFVFSCKIFRPGAKEGEKNLAGALPPPPARIITQDALIL